MNKQSLIYVLDSNVFIEASRRYYPFDFARPFWDGLLFYAKDGVICSIDKVFAEIRQGKDLLKTWAENDFSDFFITTKNENVIQAYSTIVLWAQNQPQYNQLAKDIFMEEDNADTWVLAFALANGLTIVTHEVFDFNIKKKIPIPNVCQDFDIMYCDTFKMLRGLQFSF